MKRVTAAKVAVVAVVAALIAGGGTRLFFYASSPATTSLSSTPSGGNALSGSASQSEVPPCGSQNSHDLPYGCWADYLGYLPSGYVLAAHCVNCAIYQCPAGMSLDKCKQFEASCGDFVCDPNESCNTCAIDCLAPGQTCDPYTGRAGSPIGVCQVTLNATIG
ncbi:MAG: hypothetical protein OK455_06565 [Thaumarchaeota archaeon]|nr:hypothetical protein [Nitrososphaerota archaeon]